MVLLQRLTSCDNWYRNEALLKKSAFSKEQGLERNLPVAELAIPRDIITYQLIWRISVLPYSHQHETSSSSQERQNFKIYLKHRDLSEILHDGGFF